MDQMTNISFGHISYSVLTTTNIATPLASWTVLTMGNFDATGAFSVTNVINAGNSEQFYSIRQP
jgi:hypothetical protein